MAEEKGVVKYAAKDGQEITLTFETVRNYLVSGKKELLTPQELIFFMGICKSRGLNPFKKDAYLIKYSDDPAAIVTSIDFYRARARAQEDCQGWKSGIVIQKKDGAIEYREGALLLEGEKLVGGWFEGQPKGWNNPKKHSVTLKGYVKRTKAGEITRFWQEDNQPSQIMKVAESQGLRMLWPDEFQQLYSEEEILSIPQDTGTAMADLSERGQKDEPSAVDMDFDKLVLEYCELDKEVQTGDVQKSIGRFVAMVAKSNNATEQAVKSEAIKKFPEFWAGFKSYSSPKKGRPPKEKPEEKNVNQVPEPSKGPAPEKQPDPPPGPHPPSLFQSKKEEAKW